MYRIGQGNNIWKVPKKESYVGKSAILLVLQVEEDERYDQVEKASGIRGWSDEEYVLFGALGEHLTLRYSEDFSPFSHYWRVEIWLGDNMVTEKNERRFLSMLRNTAISIDKNSYNKYIILTWQNIN